MRPAPPASWTLSSGLSFAGAKCCARGALANRGLLVVVFVEVARGGSELEHGDFATAAMPETHGNHRGTDTRPYIDRSRKCASWLAASVEPVDVPMSDDLAEYELVELGDGNLTGMGMSRQDEGDPHRPQGIGLFGNVGQGDAGNVGA